MITPEQKRYISSQVALMSEIFNKVEYDPILGDNNLEVVSDIARTIYQGYVLSDIEDKLSAIQMDIEKLVFKNTP